MCVVWGGEPCPHLSFIIIIATLPSSHISFHVHSFAYFIEVQNRIVYGPINVLKLPVKGGGELVRDGE